ncbi:MAG TPA: N-acetylneuraminate synthase [Syntrophorhabdales bacterium]|nr:N-acetylneuraminate synthase [Syntrophorhabdales bacterium]
MNFDSRDFSFRDVDKTVVIAEVGVNHNGDVQIAKKMIEAAAKAGAEIVKFQAFRSEKEISRFAAKTPYQRETTTDKGSQLEMCKALELKASDLVELKNYCGKLNVPFLCAAFDFDSVDLLVDQLKVETIKVASSEVTNIPFLHYIGSKKKGVILSTGASTLPEVGLAIEALQQSGCPELVLFHCVSSYPAPHAEVNLRCMTTLKNSFGLPVGFSDHTIGTASAIAAAALGACAIEKHFTLDRTMVGPDHRASVEPHELAEMVSSIKIANLSLGSPFKQPAPCELQNLALIRKSLVAARNLRKGVKLTRDMIEIKRPRGGIEPSDLDKVLGRTLNKDIDEDMFLTWKDLK